MRPIYLVLQDLIKLLTVPVVARLCGVSEGLVRKWCEDPERSGKVPALVHVLKLMAHSATQPLAEIQTLLDELLGHFIPQTRRLVRTDLIASLLADIQALHTGRPPALTPNETVLMCNECTQPLRIFALSTGRIRYECAGCR